MLRRSERVERERRGEREREGEEEDDQRRQQENNILLPDISTKEMFECGCNETGDK